MQPQLISRRCPAQAELCKAIRECAAGAIQFVQDDDEPLGGRIVFDYARCDGCGRCVAACCGQAIEMVEN